MITDGQIGDLPLADRTREAAPGSSGATLRAGQIVDIVDHLLGELGRREHRFAWLRDPSGAADDWIAVDAYYPASQLILRCCQDEDPLEDLLEELVPRHGLRLLHVATSDIGADRRAAVGVLARTIESLGPAPQRAVEPPIPRYLSRPAHDGTVSRAFSGLAQPEHAVPRVGLSQAAAAQRAARLVAARQAAGTPLPRVQAPPRERPLPRVQPRPPRARPELSTPPPLGYGRAVPEAAPRAGGSTIDLPVGLVMGLAVLIEVYVGVAVVGFDGGKVLLAIGFAFDACSRALGTVAAERDGEHVWSWACALLGCLFVAAFTLWQERGPVETEPAPLAGLVSLVAMIVLALALSFMALHL
jgi:hypothetical protein